MRRQPRLAAKAFRQLGNRHGRVDGKLVRPEAIKLTAQPDAYEMTANVELTEMLGDKEVYKMEVTVSGDLLNEMIKAAAEAEGEDSEALKDIDLTGADAGLVLYIIKDTKLPAKVSIDCTELGNVLMQKMSEDKSFTSKATKFEITMDNIEYDTIDELKIPDEVISSATDADSVNLFENVPGM